MSDFEGRAELLAALKAFDKVHRQFNDMILDHVPDAEIVAYLDGAMDHAMAIGEIATAKALGNDVAGAKEAETVYKALDSRFDYPQRDGTDGELMQHFGPESRR